MNTKIIQALVAVLTICFMSESALAKVTVKLELVAEGLIHPLVLLSPPDGTKRRFIVEQSGSILILKRDGTLLPKPFLDIGSKMVTLRKDFDERGLLGMAFHPKYASNGKFYVYYSAPMRNNTGLRTMLYWNHTAHVSEFTVSKDDPSVADPASERILMQIDQPQFNHNGGALAFGPDGYLYISLGDGGFADDVAIGHTKGKGNAQDTSNLLGSILRIDVDSGDPYGIPADNPFVHVEGARPEIYAYGFRNPWRMAFDAGGSNGLYAADVGQNSFESVDLVVKGGNHGWNVMEGTHCFDSGNPNKHLSSCKNGGMISPIIEYGNSKTQEGGKGRSITGGFIYRGSLMPSLQGAYIFGDWSKQFLKHDGALLVARPPTTAGAMWEVEDVEVEGQQFNAYVLAFGQDADNEVYVLTTNNTAPTRANDKIYKLVLAK
jgi:glucose/arabinose dehydrogenase